MEMVRSVRFISRQEMDELDRWVELGMGLMAHYGVDPLKSIYANLDAVYAAWATEASPRYTDEQVALGLGAVFGDRLARKHRCAWQFVEDQYGSDFALTIRGREIYPIAFVAKRIATLSTPEPESGFFAGMDEVIDDWPLV